MDHYSYCCSMHTACILPVLLVATAAVPVAVLSSTTTAADASSCIAECAHCMYVCMHLMRSFICNYDAALLLLRAAEKALSSATQPAALRSLSLSGVLRSTTVGGTPPPVATPCADKQSSRCQTVQREYSSGTLCMLVVHSCVRC
jgi:hypothetical protein